MACLMRMAVRLNGHRISIAKLKRTLSTPHVTTVSIKARSEEEAIAQVAKGLGEEYDTDFCEVQDKSEWSAEADYVPSEEN